jgi:hypothetical protein
LQENAYPNQHPNDEPSIEARLEDCRAGLKSLVASLHPSAPLDEIDLPRLNSMIGEVGEYILLFDHVVNGGDTASLEDSEIDFLERSCQSASTVYKSLVSAINWLRTARRALATIEKSITSNKGFNVNLQNDYYNTCLDGCRQALATTLENIYIKCN